VPPTSIAQAVPLINLCIHVQFCADLGFALCSILDHSITNLKDDFKPRSFLGEDPEYVAYARSPARIAARSG